MADVTTENPYGLVAALEQGGIIAQVIFGIMVLMSVVSWYIIITKWFEQRKMLAEAANVEKKVWSSSSLKDGTSKLETILFMRELARRSTLQAYSVHPGGIDTGMLGSIMDRYVELGAVPSREVALQGIVANHPIGRMGRPDEMGGGVVYLCSEAASFVTCTEFLMDGGFSQV